MSCVEIFNETILGEHITIEQCQDDQGNDYIIVYAPGTNPPETLLPIVDEHGTTFPVPQANPSKRYKSQYKDIGDMLSKFAGETGRTSDFTDTLKKALGKI